jgi:hypothetical protein
VLELLIQREDGRDVPAESGPYLSRTTHALYTCTRMDGGRMWSALNKATAGLLGKKGRHQR